MSNCSFHRQSHRGVIQLSGVYAMNDFGFLFLIDVPKFKLIMVGARVD